MTRFEFEEKYQTWSTPNTNDVLMRVASNLSDLHIEKDFFTPNEMDAKLNAIKQFIFDWQKVLRLEEQYAKYEKQEMDEFNSHLGNII
jgi:hypothetical protein